MNSKAFSLPLILILISFIVLPLLFWKFQFNQNDDVKGLSVESGKSGLLVKIISNSGTWELNQFLCLDIDSCSDSLTSGKKITSISGGKTSGYEVLVNYLDSWSEFKYLKIYVIPAWGSSLRGFSVLDLGNIPNTTKINFDDIEVVLIPLDNLKNSFYKSAVFSD